MSPHQMITKAFIYSDYIADLTVHLLKNQCIRIPTISVPLFRETLKLSPQCALSKANTIPVPFKQQILAHPDDVFVVETLD